MSVQVGSPAPDFDLESDSGKRVSLADYAGKWLVLYFYPRDNTPGCTREAQDFTAAASRLRALDAAVVGVSRDSVKTHCTFRDKIGIPFPLLADTELETHRAYGAWGVKTMYGRKVEGTIRSTFLIAPDSTVAGTWTGVKVDGHADKVLAAIADARGGDGVSDPTTAIGKKATKGAPAKTGAPSTTPRTPKKAKKSKKPARA